MKENHSRGDVIKDFCKGFFATLAVLLPLCAAAFFIKLPAPEIEPEPEAVPGQGSASPPVEVVTKSYNLLVMLEDESGLYDMTLARFDVADCRVKTAVVPPETVLLHNKTPATASELFDRLGALALKDCFSDTLGVPISGFILLDFDTAARLIDELGGFTFTLEKTVELINDEGLTEYRLEAGTAKLRGNDAVNILRCGDYDREGRTRLTERLWEAALLSCDKERLPDDISSFYKSAVSLFDSDISSTGIYNLTTAARVAAATSSVQTERLSGKWSNGLFELSEDAQTKLWTQFSKK